MTYDILGPNITGHDIAIEIAFFVCVAGAIFLFAWLAKRDEAYLNRKAADYKLPERYVPPAINAFDLSEDEIADLAEDAINAVALLVQTKVGQTDGGIAGVHFSDDRERDAIKGVIRRYLATERAFANMN